MKRWIVFCALVATTVAGCTPTSSVSLSTQAEDDAGDTVPEEDASDPIPVENAGDPISDPGAYAQERDAMVDSQIEARGVNNPVVLGAMRAVPRHEFVPTD